jgi:hydroxymethylpyrimidine kinase/phosphomethylpyrimidine kinase
VVLTIAGSDSGGGAGLQADLKVFAALGAYGASVVTAVTAQNTIDVYEVFPLPAELVSAQLTAVLADLPVLAVKTGILAGANIASAVLAAARAGLLPNLVIDPVLVSSTGRRLAAIDAVEPLLPYASVLTPNRDEAAALVGSPVDTVAEMAEAAAQLGAGGAAYVVVTGGDLPAPEESVDVLWSATGTQFLRAPRITTRNTHGTGCTFSAAIATRLAFGDPVPDAVRYAKRYVSRALAGARGWRLGDGAGPLDHFGPMSTLEDEP